MSVVARLLPLAIVATLATVAASPAVSAESSGTQVVEAGTALFPDRAYILTLEEKRDTRPDDERRHGDRERRAGQGARGRLVRFGPGHRHGAPDRRLEQHEGLDRRRPQGSARVRRAEPRTAALGRLLQRHAEGGASAHDGPGADRRGAREAAQADRGNAHLRRAGGSGRAGPRLGPRCGSDRPALRR